MVKKFCKGDSSFYGYDPVDVIRVGEPGKPGKPGIAKDGLSAYQIAVKKGFSGTEEEWLLSLVGPPGANGHLPVVAFSWGDAAQAVLTFSTNGVVTGVRLKYENDFTGSGASVRVGLSNGDDALLPAEWNDPYSTDWFENNPDLAVTAGQQVWITITPGTANQGSGYLFLDFFPN